MKHQARNHHKGFSGNCCCPQCNHKQPHQQGVPCRKLFCPTCKLPLEREDYIENNSNTKNHISMEYPKVNTELCTGCGACMEICPADAITIENGVAKIVEDKCRGCYACQNVCPAEAIS